jgi:hypothetical protein
MARVEHQHFFYTWLTRAFLPLHLLFLSQHSKAYIGAFLMHLGLRHIYTPPFL